MIHPPTVITLDLEAKTKVRDKGEEIERYDLETVQVRPYGLLYAHSTPDNRHVTRHISQVLPSLNLMVTRFNWRNTEHPYGKYDYYIDIIGEVKQSGEVWTLRDLYLDVLILEGKWVKVVDTEEYLQALDAGHFLPGERELALERTHWLINELSEHGYHLDAFLAAHQIQLDWGE